MDNRWHSASNKKNRARFGLQTDKFCTFRVMDHNFGSPRRVSWQRRYPKPIDQFPTINLWWPAPCLHALALVFERWSIHASTGKSRSLAALLQHPMVTFYRHLCHHFIFSKIIAAPKFYIRSTLDNRWHSASNKKFVSSFYFFKNHSCSKILHSLYIG